MVDFRTLESPQLSGSLGLIGSGIGPCNFSQILSSSNAKVKTSVYLISPSKISVSYDPFLPILTIPEQTKSKVTSSTYELDYLRSDKKYPFNVFSVLL